MIDIHTFLPFDSLFERARTAFVIAKFDEECYYSQCIDTKIGQLPNNQRSE